MPDGREIPISGNAELDFLRATLRLRKGQEGYGKNCRWIEKRIARLEKIKPD